MKNSQLKLTGLRLLVLGVVIGVWYLLTEPGIIPPFYFSDPGRAAFFFGRPFKVFEIIISWFVTGEIFGHLAVTLLETALGFVVGSVLGLGIGLWLALSPTASAIFDPYIKGFN